MKGGLSRSEVQRLYEMYGYLLLRRCRRLIRDPALAEDAFHNAIVRLLRHGSGIREATSELAWLYRVVDRCCFDVIDSRKAKHVDRPHERTPESSRGVQGRALEARSTLSAILGRLSPRDRLVAILLYDDGLTQEEVSERVGWSRQTVNKKVRAIRELAEALEQGGSH